MKKCENKQGFTLSELLIVVAIIAVLVAVAIPVFTAQVKKARLAVDHAAVRDAYAIIQIANNLEEIEIEGTTYTFAELTESGISKVFCLSEDCSSLLPANPLSIPDGSYRFQETGAENSGNCDGCVHVDPIPALLNFMPTSQWHIKEYPIYVSYINSQFVLGLVL